MTIHEAYDRKRKLHEIGKFMRDIRTHFEEDLMAVEEILDDDDLYDLREPEDNPRPASGPVVIDIHDHIHDPGNHASDYAEFRK